MQAQFSQQYVESRYGPKLLHPETLKAKLKGLHIQPGHATSQVTQVEARSKIEELGVGKTQPTVGKV